MKRIRDKDSFTDEEIEEMFYHHPKVVYDAWMEPEEDAWDKFFANKDKS